MKQGDQVIDERFPRWWDKWVNPTTVLALIGGIVWGVQLNLMVVKLAENQAANSVIVDEMVRTMQEIQLNQAKHTIILDNLVKQVRGIEIDQRAHLKEAEEWKRRIMANELNHRTSP